MALNYTCEISLALPREKVLELFLEPDNMKHWQPGFISIEHLEGEPATAGARSRLVYLWGKREMEMIETLEELDRDGRFTALYETDKVWNRVANRFESTGPESTRWVSDCEFRFQGVFMKLMGTVMPGAFKKQSMKYMKHFKEFAEDGTSLASPDA